MASGHILWAGPSRIDGSLIVAIAVGEDGSSGNRKTGAMVQTYILHAESAPIDAARSGADEAICGDCPMRGEWQGRPSLKGRACYVNLGQGPTGVFWAWRRGSYPWASDRAAIGAGRMVRVGTYGDPAAVPSNVWQELLSRASGWTGYTHQPDMVPEMRPYLMASARSEADAVRLHLAGWRTFRVAPAPMPGEVVCLSESHGKQCEQCGLCNGAGENGARVRVKSIVITAHGSGARYAQES